jgi:hypothetical protein
MGLRPTLAGALLAPLLLLAACGGHTSVADPPVAPAPTTSPTHAPKRESPDHFIRRWAAEDTRMQNTGETSKFRQMAKGCEGCLAVARFVDSTYAAGGRIETKGWSLMKVIPDDLHRGTQTFDFTVDSAPTTYWTSAGSSAKRFRGGRERFQLRLAPMSGSWVVTEFVQVAI